MESIKIKFFGTDGIRGNSSKFPFYNSALWIIGKSIVEIFGNKGYIFIIRDTRESGKRIQKELARGIISCGVKLIFGGIMPTAAASLIVQNLKYSTAIVISASHNSYIDNGIKIFNSNGLKLDDLMETRIEDTINKNLNMKPCFFKKKVFIKEEKTFFLKIYKNFIIKNFLANNLKNKTIILDCANGVSSKYATYILKKLGAKVVALNIKPNGKNINLNCGSLYPNKLAKIVKYKKAFCGFAFDGDGDRLVCIDEKGIVRDGDYFLASMAIWLKNKGKLKNNILITNFMSNFGLLQLEKRENINIIFSEGVGDKYISEDVKKYQASIGGEQSGHFIFGDILPTGDGMLSAIMILSALCDTNNSMSKFMDVIKKLPQIVINKKILKKVPINKLLNSCELIKHYKKYFGKNGRILIRYSGTENIIRVMVESKKIKKIKEIAMNIANSIEKEIVYMLCNSSKNT
ncbi:MAG: hypothetical protein LBQ07_01275 [Endomicrobium sp.]|jgi:phosphoglucosamine mutase|nr:hypothetical protein [Endomicrobium sp.]